MFFNMEKVVFLIDGAYLSFISKCIGNEKHIKFKIEQFARNVSIRSNLFCELIYYYTSPPYQSPNPGEEENARKANYDKFLKKLNISEKLFLLDNC